MRRLGYKVMSLAGPLLIIAISGSCGLVIGVALAGSN